MTIKESQALADVIGTLPVDDLKALQPLIQRRIDALLNEREPRVAFLEDVANLGDKSGTRQYRADDNGSVREKLLADLEGMWRRGAA